MKRILFGVLAFAMAATLSACPRDKDGGEAPADTPGTRQDIPDTPPAVEEPPVTGAETEGETPAEGTAADGAATDTPAEGEAVAPPADGTTPAEDGKDAAAPAEAGTTKVVFETTKGKIVMEVHPEWAPIGAAHFLELVNAKFYDGAPWFRVIEGFVAQCGVAKDPAMNTAWMDKTILDEPVVQGNAPGFVAFGKSGAPNSRSTHIFINYGDNSASLDPQGFSCFAKVVEGMDVALKLTRCEYGDQAGLAGPGGIDAFKKMFPEADFITKAYVQK